MCRSVQRSQQLRRGLLLGLASAVLVPTQKADAGQRPISCLPVSHHSVSCLTLSLTLCSAFRCAAVVERHEACVHLFEPVFADQGGMSIVDMDLQDLAGMDLHQL
jgi:hypothetical protein